jgi:hypothetical protein
VYGLEIAPRLDKRKRSAPVRDSGSGKRAANRHALKRRQRAPRFVDQHDLGSDQWVGETVVVDSDGLVVLPKPRDDVLGPSSANTRH